MAHSPARVVEFWRAVEYFSPQRLPERDAGTHDIGPGELMPWEPGSRLYEAPREGRVWRYEVFGGVYELSRIRDTLVTLYGEDEATGGQRAGVAGQSALFGCTVDGDGVLVPKTAVLSSCAWAIGRAVTSPGHLSLDGFQQDRLQYGEALSELAGAGSGAGAALRLLADSLRAAVPEATAETVKAVVAGALTPVAGPVVAIAGGTLAGSTAGKVVDAMVNGAPPQNAAREELARPEPERLDLSPLRGEGLQRFVAQLANRLGVSEPLQPQRVRVRSYQVASTRAEGQTEPSAFLNSFFANDLDRVAAALEKGDVGPALAAYLTSGTRIDAARRIDVRTNPDAVRHGCEPDRIPPGRWVTNLDRSLALSQQFAVNEILARLGDGAGLFAVNGPPGTGKTTMLRDLIAAIVVTRAERLAELSNPAEAFISAPPWRWQTDRWRHSIAPLNPLLTGAEIVVASSNNGAVENVTKHIPGPDGLGTDWQDAAEDVDYFASTACLVHGDEAWGMVAAQLGNATNRRAFAQRFYWGKAGQPGRHPECMKEVLDDLRTQPVDWPTATGRFRAAREKVQILANERARVSAAVAALPALRRDANAAAEKATDADEQVRSLQRQRTGQSSAVDAAKLRVQQTAAGLDRHREGRPGLIVSVSTLFRAGREWHAEHKALMGVAAAARQNLEAVRLILSATDEKLAEARRERADALGQLDRLKTDCVAAQQKISHARRQWGDHVADIPDELTEPWADRKFACARTQLFLAALALHKTLIAAEAGRINQNLNALMDVLQGNGRPAPEALLAAWQTLFLVVPVLSTTFASLPVMFGGLGRESIGWLLIDEAGQAPPQQAAGAIWRAQRAVVIGDPLQLEPVVTLPSGGQQALLRMLDVDEEWAPGSTSVQRVADRLAPFGTYLHGSTEDADRIWVGAPLRVHRRCDQPMLDVSNEIAYNGMMVNGTPARGPFPGRNIWHDIRSPHAVGHWIPAEGERLRWLLHRLEDAGVPVDQIRVISPFRRVVAGASEVHRMVFGDACSDSSRKEWVGTVHTMQGKEADVVIIVLGGNPDQPAARTFATQAPNLLNVAVTRAKRRLYVIGNRATWGTATYFDALARHLPTG
jgi:hypothetical protein